MDEYCARQPIFNKSMHVTGYRLIFGPDTKRTIFGIYDHETEAPEGPPAETPDTMTLDVLSDRHVPYIDYTEDFLSSDGSLVLNTKAAASAVIVFDGKAAASIENCRSVKAHGFQVVLHSAHIIKNPALANYADIIQIDFPSVSSVAQFSLIKQYRAKAFLAARLESWEDCQKAKEMDYKLYQGNFFLRPVEGQQNEIMTLNANLVSILRELDTPYPNFRKISLVIEHDLGLAYRLLRLVNSAYMAPRYKIYTISQAITFLGTREMYQWISMLMFNGIKNEGNAELIKRSLVRGKLMELIAQRLRLDHNGSEPFFTGLFSLLDIIMNKKMDELLTGLQLPDTVKDALRGKDNALKRLLTFVTDYELARWQKLEGVYPLDQIKTDTMVALYFNALKWAASDV